VSPGQVDSALVRRHLLALDAAVQALRRHAGRPAEALRSDTDETWIVERGLQLCAQNCLDVATHLVASAGIDVPDYASAIERMEQIGALPAEFVRGFRGIAGFRNILVHGYLAVDLDLVHRLLNERLDDFIEFARHVERYLSPHA
jgi:uncharacterized protein YutE (UPF0331/DUF86 family)